jgi:hypothetical protein
MQAVLETIKWPDEIVRPSSFMTALSNGKLKERGSKNRRQDVEPYEFWSSLYADDLVVFFEERVHLDLGAKYLVNHFKKFGLLVLVHTGKVGTTYNIEDCSRY